MESNWHHEFNPQSFLKKVDLQKLLSHNDTYAENKVNKLGKPCILCSGITAPGLLLNEGSYICKRCYEEISQIEYPEIYEKLKREYLLAKEARGLARKSLIEKSIELKIKKYSDIAIGLSFLLYFFNLGFIVLTIGFIVLSRQLKNAHNKKLSRWAKLYPEISEPILRHFHDPQAQLTFTYRDKVVLYIFNHWPGYPPFWDYLREIVLNRDNRRCQVTGCPSRLELHIHHIMAVSNGGEHSPGNLIALCDFHHALEPEKGHERVWGKIKNRYFTLVCEHHRSNRSSMGTHKVHAHLRRLQLITIEELKELNQTYGFSCPSCGSTHVKFTLFIEKNRIVVDCYECAKSIEGPQELTEETGPRLAELLRVTRNQGRWLTNWEVLSDRKDSLWGNWKGKDVAQKRKDYKMRVDQTATNPTCPECGAAMRLIKPWQGVTWKPFWGCTQYRINQCPGKVPYIEHSK